MKDQNGFVTIALQFRFPNATSVPPAIMSLKQRVVDQKHTDLRAGKLIIEPTETVTLEIIHRDLEVGGYTLVNAFCEERANTRGAGKHYVVKFIFAKGRIVESFKRARAFVRLELLGVCKSALWRTRAYSNPLADNTRGMNIVCDTRQPFIQGDGQVVVIWQRDKAGEKMGDTPLPLTAGHCLRIAEGDVHLLARQAA